MTRNEGFPTIQPGGVDCAISQFPRLLKDISPGVHTNRPSLTHPPGTLYLLGEFSGSDTNLEVFCDI